jgi:hypothetical protein
MPDSMTEMRFTLLRQLFDMAVEQRRALDEDDFASFQSVLEARGALIARLEALAADGPSAVLPGNVIPFPRAASQAEDLDDRLAIDTLIRGVLEHDQHNESVLEERLLAVQGEIRSMESGQRAVSRYGSAAEDARFINHAV